MHIAKTILLLLCLAVSGICTAKQRYLFYLHGRIVEVQGPNAVDKDHGWGAYQYNDILKTFSSRGFTVISECRPPDTDVNKYAQKVAAQIDSLLKKGAKAADITVVGASKGGAIAMLVSGIAKHPGVNYVFLGCCPGTFAAQGKLCGNILSIYELSDDIGQSCGNVRQKSPNPIPNFKEIAINTGRHHGFLYHPLAEWVEPTVAWAKENYR